MTSYKVMYVKVFTRAIFLNIPISEILKKKLHKGVNFSKKREKQPNNEYKDNKILDLTKNELNT